VLLISRFESMWEGLTSALRKPAAVVPLRRFVSSIVDGPFGSSLTSAHYSESGTRVILA
jgi:type I restriction enzyme S subunit